MTQRQGGRQPATFLLVAADGSSLSWSGVGRAITSPRSPGLAPRNHSGLCLKVPFFSADQLVPMNVRKPGVSGPSTFSACMISFGGHLAPTALSVKIRQTRKNGEHDLWVHGGGGNCSMVCEGWHTCGWKEDGILMRGREVQSCSVLNLMR